MTSYKKYKSVSEFPLHTQKINREELEAAYQELRNSYRSLTNSRGQLIRRQNEAKTNLVSLQEKLKNTTTAIEKINAERENLQKSLTHSVEVQQQLKNWGDSLNEQVGDLSNQVNATNQLLEEFESVYEEVKSDNGLLSIVNRLSLLLKATNRLLNTDIKELISQKKMSGQQNESWTEETPAAINRRLLDE